jgi:hypothetical protein
MAFKNQEDFIRQSIEVHQNNYDYSLVHYKDSCYTKVKIKCKKHDYIFEKIPYNHVVKKSGCPKCNIEKDTERKKMSTEEFIKRSIEKHGDKYDYSLVEYKNLDDKVKIICKEHGIFEVSPTGHLRGQDCNKCYLKTRTKGVDKFIEQSKAIHGDFYDYSKVEYKNTDTKVIIICPEHGEFLQTPYLHAKGSGCKLCYNKRTSNRQLGNWDMYLLKAREVHGDRYDYSKLTKFTGVHDKYKIICEEHGVFEQSFSAHMRGAGCPKCANIRNGLLNNEKSRYTFVEKARKIHGNKYLYDINDYIDAHQTKMKITCPEHGIFYQYPNDHLNGRGCLKCSNSGRYSKAEKEVLDFIRRNYNGEVLENVKKVISKELDIYLPELKLAIEFNGLYWHCELNKDNLYHLNKTEECEQKGIHLIHIFEDDWQHKREIVESRLLYYLNKLKVIYARECQLKELSSNEASIFLKENHLQGSVNSLYNYGLYYKDELVSIMTFGNLRTNLGQHVMVGMFELLRFANKRGLTVVGGANKLFQYFINNKSFEKIISYADRSWTMNNDQTIYHVLGFKKIRNTRPNYFYIVGDKRENRFKFRKDVLIREGFDSSKSEHEIMLDREIYRIYNSGNLYFEYEKKFDFM